MELSAGVSKQDIRERIWDFMESQNLADFPRPVHHRIPNFKGSYLACQNIKDLEVFARTQEVKVDPDKPLEGVRLLVLQKQGTAGAVDTALKVVVQMGQRSALGYFTCRGTSKKTLLVPTPRLRTGLFNKITPPPGATKAILRKCATSQGVRDHSVPVGLESRLRVDLLVVGSVAVSEKGWRIGKGEGYADLEYAMMVSMGAVSQGTPVVTIVHDCQVVDIPEALLEDHDLTVDYILTPTRVITTGCERPKPAGITWSKISYEMMRKIPILRSLRYQEKRAGKDVTLQDEHQHLPEVSNQQPAPLSTARRPQDPPHLGSGSMQLGDVPPNTVYIGNLPRDARVRELKTALRELGAAPRQLTWQGPQRGAWLHYQDPVSAQQALSCLQGLCLGTSTLTVALARQQRADDSAGSHAGLSPSHL